MIYITGDIHGYPNRFSSGIFPEQEELTKEDYVIILGDFGLIWDFHGENKNEKYWLDWLEERPWTTLWVDGNHENFDRIYGDEYPIEEWHGGMVQKIRPSVIHLMRGEVFELQGKKFLSMGGASSHDIQDGILEPGDPQIKKWHKDYRKMFRVNHQSWWKQEVPSNEEQQHCYTTLLNNDMKVDYVLTHEAPASDVILLSKGFFQTDKYSQWLEELRCQLDYKAWFFGHYHENMRINDREFCLYEQITRIL